MEIVVYAGAVAEAEEDRILSMAGYVGLGFNNPKKLYDIRLEIPKLREIERAGEYGTDLDRITKFFEQAGHRVRKENG